nr:acetate--CoA ligase family protein [Mycobacterium sp. KBS0706]
MARLFDLAELFDAVETLASRLHVDGDRLAILTNGGGTGVLATEALGDAGGTIASLSAETMAHLDAALPPTWSRGNPVDIIGDATGERYALALEAMLADPGKDAVLVMNCPTAVADPIEAAQAVVRSMEEKAKRDGRRPPILTCWLGEGAVAAARRLFAEHRIPSYATPGQAARAFMHLVRYRRNQALLMETPPALPQDFAPDPAAAKSVIAAALTEGRSMLTEPESKQVLEAYRIPVVRTRSVAADPDAAAEAAAGFLGPVALKILSPDITHKSDLGGVAGTASHSRHHRCVFGHDRDRHRSSDARRAGSASLRRQSIQLRGHLPVSGGDRGCHDPGPLRRGTLGRAGDHRDLRSYGSGGHRRRDVVGRKDRPSCRSRTRTRMVHPGGCRRESGRQIGVQCDPWIATLRLDHSRGVGSGARDRPVRGARDLQVDACKAGHEGPAEGPPSSAGRQSGTAWRR